LHIKNGQNIKNPNNISNIANISNLSNISDIPDISQIKATKNNISDDLPKSDYARAEINKINKVSRRSKNRGRNRKNAENTANRLTKYLYDRKYFILLFSVIYIIGLIIGAILIKNIDAEEIIALRNVIDNYFTDVSSVSIISRIINNIAVNSVILFLAYLSGVTVFAPFVCATICLYKGLSCGYITGVYISGGADWFHIKICCLTFIFYLLIMLCVILSCSESTGFSVFLLKSRDTYRSSLSFSNIAAYSARYLLLLIFTSLLTILQTAIISLVYSISYP